MLGVLAGAERDVDVRGPGDHDAGAGQPPGGCLGVRGGGRYRGDRQDGRGGRCHHGADQRARSAPDPGEHPAAHQPRPASSPLAQLRDQPGHHGRLRVWQHPVHSSGVQEHCLIAEPRHLRVVGDDHHGRPVRGLPQQAQHPGRGVRVQGPGGLVGEDHVRAGDQRAGDRHSLLLAAGQLGRPPPELSRGQAHPGGRPLDVRPPRGTVVQAQRKRDVLRHRQLRQQVQLLEHEADALPPQHRLPTVGQPRQFLPAQPHRA